MGRLRCIGQRSTGTYPLSKRFCVYRGWTQTQRTMCVGWSRFSVAPTSTSTCAVFCARAFASWCVCAWISSACTRDVHGYVTRKGESRAGRLHSTALRTAGTWKLWMPC